MVPYVETYIRSDFQYPIVVFLFYLYCMTFMIKLYIRTMRFFSDQ